MEDTILSEPSASESERRISSRYVRVGGETAEGEGAGSEPGIVAGEFNHNLK